jgi:hypothetical protein
MGSRRLNTNSTEWLTKLSAGGVLVGLGVSGTPVAAGPWEELEAVCGPRVTFGQDLTVAQIEGLSGSAYLPTYQAGPGPWLIQGGVMDGMTVWPMNGATTVASSHAGRVATEWFSRAAGVSASRHYSALSWMYGSWLRPTDAQGRALAPLVDGAVVQNHSWVITGNSTSYNDLLRRLDYAVGRDGITVVVATNNGQTTLPQMVVTGYNTLAVGMISGNHAAGVVGGVSDGPGRQKPDLVAEGPYTSYSTPLVSAAATTLIDFASRSTATAAARQPEVVKALLFAGARTDHVASWSITPTQPLDLRYGAGEADVARSHDILAQSVIRIDHSVGWASVGLAAGQVWERPFVINGPQMAVGYRAALCWLRTLSITAQTPFTVVPDTLPNLRLELWRTGAAPSLVTWSDSPVDNAELIVTGALSPGAYALRVRGDLPSRCGVAWRTEWQDDPSLPLVPLTAALQQDATSILLAVTGLKQGRIYVVECSEVLTQWQPRLVFNATSPAMTLPVPGLETLRRCFLRVVLQE